MASSRKLRQLQLLADGDPDQNIACKFVSEDKLPQVRAGLGSLSKSLSNKDRRHVPSIIATLYFVFANFICKEMLALVATKVIDRGSIPPDDLLETSPDYPYG